MNAKALLTVGLAVTVLIGGVAAVGAAAPADVPANNAQVNDTDDTNQSPANVTDDEQQNSSPPVDTPVGDAETDNDSAGPPTALPEQAPSHVSDIHETISSFLNDELDNLGNSLSELLTADDTSADSSTNASNASE